MNKEKWLSIGLLIGSIVLFFVLIGVMAWHYFHDHHGDTKTNDPIGATNERPNTAVSPIRVAGMPNIARNLPLIPITDPLERASTRGARDVS